MGGERMDVVCTLKKLSGGRTDSGSDRGGQGKKEKNCAKAGKW